MENITNIAQWKDLLEKSYARTIIIYKHSDYCAICTNAQNILLMAIKEEVIKDPIYKVVVHDNRDVSDVIANDLHIKHESPQIILVKEGQVLYSASHYDINIEDITLYLNQ